MSMFKRLDIELTYAQGYDIADVKFLYGKDFALRPGPNPVLTDV